MSVPDPRRLRPPHILLPAAAISLSTHPLYLYLPLSSPAHPVNLTCALLAPLILCFLLYSISIPSIYLSIYTLPHVASQNCVGLLPDALQPLIRHRTLHSSFNSLSDCSLYTFHWVPIALRGLPPSAIFTIARYSTACKFLLLTYLLGRVASDLRLLAAGIHALVQIASCLDIAS